jgi:hypothetical protein
MNTQKKVFLSSIQMRANPKAIERLRTVTDNIEWLADGRGAWIRKGSTAHSLACVLGLDPYDYDLTESGTWDRYGRVK